MPLLGKKCAFIDNPVGAYLSQTQTNKISKKYLEVLCSKMALANVLLLSQISGHVLLFILSLCIVLPLSINLNQFWYVCCDVVSLLFFHEVTYMTNKL